MDKLVLLVIPVLCVEAIKAGLCHVRRELGLLFSVMSYTVPICLQLQEIFGYIK